MAALITQHDVDKDYSEPHALHQPQDELAEDDPDSRSVFVKNVDFSADEQQLIEHFKECGDIARVTIRKDKNTQQPIG